MKDLFQYYQEQTEALKTICDHWQAKDEAQGLTYKDCKEFLKEVEAIGYTFNYGLDAQPYNLVKL
tara:strand:- start:2228 stop:2422 length:195 start_codon:yes stop_codon:yes gene_type:complete